MTWVKLDDKLPEHPKLLAAGDQAAWLFVSGLCWCARHLRNGRIPTEVLPRLTGFRKPAQLADRLVEAGLWERVDGGFLVHDYLDYQESEVDVKERRRATAARVAKHRAKRSSPQSNGVSNAAPGPGPLPGPAEVEEGVSTSPSTERATGAPELVAGLAASLRSPEHRNGGSE